MTIHNNSNNPVSEHDPLVAIVVPVYNAEKTIFNCLTSLLNLDYLNLKIILVDDYSTDNTEYKIELFQKSRDSFSLIKNKTNKGPAASRNKGINFALDNDQPEYIFFTDSDCVVPKDWIQQLLSNFEEGTAAVGGSLEPASLRTIYERFEQKRRDRLYGKEEKFVEELPTCNLAIRTETFKHSGIFDETFKYPAGEDFDLCRRIVATGKKILYCPYIKVKHYHQDALKNVLRRGYIHGHEEMKTKQYPLSKWKLFLYYLRPSVVPFRGFLRQRPSFTFVNFFFEMGKSWGKLKGYYHYSK